jgi:transcriptional antiterminator RfaH
MSPMYISPQPGLKPQMNLPWYVLRSQPHKEIALWREVNARGMECFYPQLRVRPVNPRSRSLRPYFPGYLFLHTDVEQVGFGTFKWMPFSGGLLAFDDIPATVPHTLVQAIRQHVERINAAGGEMLSTLKHGDSVVIRGGPFDGYEAIFDARLPGRERVRVLLTLLQRRDVNVELPLGQIERLQRK